MAFIKMLLKSAIVAYFTLSVVLLQAQDAHSFCANCADTDLIARVGPEDEAAQKAFLQKKELQAEVAIFPVPAREELTIKAPDNFKGNTELLMFNMEGRAFYSENVAAEILKDFKVDLNKINLSSGVYYIRLLNNGNTITRKFIKE